MDLRVSASIISALLIAAVPLPAGGSGEQVSALVGNVLSHPVPAQDFSLTDQQGLAFRLSEARGKVVVLTFIYTHCTDTCPSMALKVREAITLLGSDADRAVFVAVTTDPLRDTRMVTADYSRAAGLENAWRFLSGPASAVAAVWRAYGIGVARKDGRDEAAPDADEALQTRGLSRDDLMRAGEIAGRFGGGYEVSHSTPFWLIDGRGRLRVSLGADAAPVDLAADVRILLKGR